MNLNLSKWKRIRFGDLIESDGIYKAKAYSKEDIGIIKYPSKETIPYVTRTELNNSVEAFVEQENLDCIEFGNALVVGDTTATVSYQRDSFIAGDHIVVIRAKWLNEYTGLFFETLLNKEKFRYSYGRAFIKDLIMNTNLLVPVTANNTPDYEEMERIIKLVKHKPITTAINRSKNKDINYNNWKYFEVGQIFKKRKLKKHSSSPDSVGDVPFISSTALNNGVSSYVDEITLPGNCISVSTNGGCFDSFYQKDDIAISSDVELLYHDELNEFNSLFICTILAQEKYKWSYGRKPKNDKLFKTKILLPVELDSNDELKIDEKNIYSNEGYIPDWKYMENYIKKLPYGDVLQKSFTK